MKVTVKSVKARINRLKKTEKTFRDIFDIMFSQEDLIISEDSDRFRKKLHTYGEIKQRIINLSGILNQKIPTRNWVGIEMENSTDWIVAFWAVLRSGNKPYLINLRHAPSMSEDIIKSLNIKDIICTEEGQLNAQYHPISELEKIAPAPSFDGNFADEFAISTSASTMNRVVCFYSGEKIVNQLINAVDVLDKCPRMAKGYKGEIKQLALLPFYHIFGFMAVYLWYSFFGATMVFPRDNSPKTLLKTCQNHRVTTIFSVPLFWHSIEDEIKKEIAKQPLKKQKKFEKARRFCVKLQNINFKLGMAVTKKLMSKVNDSILGPSVQICISGGSYIKNSTLELLNSLGFCLRNGFGMSEVGITSVEHRNQPKYLNMNCIGQPIGTTRYKISPQNTLLIGGDALCTGMMINGVMSEMPLWYDTKDIVESIGGNLRILGRTGDLVIGENGENINPDIIEQEFDIPHAVRFSVLGLGETCEQQLSLIVQVAPNISKTKLKEIQEAVYQCNQKLPLTIGVKKFYFTFDDIMPSTAIKVGRKYLLEQIKKGTVKLLSFAESDRLSADGINLQDPSDLSENIIRIISQTADVPAEKITPQSHLIFDLGLSSMQYLSVIMALEDEFGVPGLLDKDNNLHTLQQVCDRIKGAIK